MLGSDRCINLYPEPIESDTGKNRLGLVPTPGKSLFATLASGNGRGIWSGDAAEFYAVAGSRLYRITDPGAGVTDLGNVDNDSLPVNIFSNGGTQLAVVSNDKLWVSTGGAPTEITTCPAAVAAGGNGVDMGCTVDGYGIVVEKNTNEVFISALGDFTSWNALDVQIWYAAQDRIAMITGDANHRLWLLGRKSIEAWANVGGSGFPFQRIAGTAMNTGLAAPFGWAFVPGLTASDQLCFLSSNDRGGLRVYAMRGYEPVRISNNSVETFMEGYTVSDAVGNGYIRGGHSFFILNFPTSNAGWAYDFQTGMWHERYTGAPASRLEPVGRFHTCPTISKSHFWLSGSSGKIYKDDVTLHQEEGAAIHRERTGPNAHNGNQESFFGTFQLECDEDAAGTVELEVSYNNGKTFNTARSRTGAVLEWNRNGRGRSFVPRVRWSGNERRVVINAHFDADAGTGY